MPKKLFRVKWSERRICTAEVFAVDEDAAIDCLYYGDIQEKDIDVYEEEIIEVLDSEELNG